ncbi:MAG: CAP domain-containing protein [Actinobacteria bacterium]|nr:CAP domain-containing protein [Actinomycetota bacterium]
MPSRRVPDARQVQREDPLDRFTIRGREPAPAPVVAGNPYQRVVRTALTVGVLVAGVLLAPRMIGTGPRPTLTDVTTTRGPVTTQLPRPGAAPQAASPTSAAGLADPTTGYGSQLLGLVNRERAQRGCQPVRTDPRLTAAAQEHTSDMAAHDLLSHTGSNGSTMLARAEAHGFTGSVGENVARGYPTPTAVMTAWMASSGHRANIVNCSYTAMGAAYAAGGWWTQVFGG